MYQADGTANHDGGGRRVRRDRDASPAILNGERRDRNLDCRSACGTGAPPDEAHSSAMPLPVLLHLTHKNAA
jgi:hypothetical protein